MVQSDKIKSIAALHKTAPKTKIIMLSSQTSGECVHRALNDGACGFIVKQAPSSDVVNAIHQVMDGHYYLSSSIQNRVIETYLEGARTKPRKGKGHDKYSGFNQLSDREKEVFYLLLDGHSSREISTSLNISPKTADKHRSSIFKKTGVENSTQLLHYAIDRDIVPTPHLH